MSERTYAIGDVHGHASLLQNLLEAIDADAAGRAYDLVFLGDYINKGPSSAGVLSHLANLKPTAGKIIFLKGNHEADLLASLTDERTKDKWLAMGGRRTLDEFGVQTPDALPRDILDWIANLPTFYEDELRCFVHAGLDPSRHRLDQTDRDRLTMRGDFLNTDHDFGRHVVHGHTPQLTGLPEIRPFRTNLDTGVVTTNLLTAGVFTTNKPGGPAGILQAKD